MLPHASGPFAARPLPPAGSRGRQSTRCVLDAYHARISHQACWNYSRPHTSDDTLLPDVSPYQNIIYNRQDEYARLPSSCLTGLPAHAGAQTKAQCLGISTRHQPRRPLVRRSASGQPFVDTTDYSFRQWPETRSAASCCASARAFKRKCRRTRSVAGKAAPRGVCRESPDTDDHWARDVVTLVPQ